MSKPQKIYLKDYTKPDYAVANISLYFNLNEDLCRVTNLSKIKKTNTQSKDLFLDGEGLTLASLKLNGQAWDYSVEAKGLLVKNVPTEFDLEIETHLKPQENTSLEGLYKSGTYFITQCEAQGFRRITYYLDRPDVMTTFDVTIEADEKKYPQLLSNGDRVKEEKLSGGRHLVKWHDPHKKPCYLFALVAGDFGCLKNEFTTMSGKKVNLEIYCTHGKEASCEHAMVSLQKSMKWDEERFGREYDLSTYMIVATDDFNAGAMENKGLNVFNSRLVFANAKTATDDDYLAIESVIAHEYFHNWTGNRVTLRDWFHLSLKEGLTVFRDQEFSMDMSSRELIRIDNVDDLRSHQFAEDAGPNAHPIRPSSCFAVDNFFTATIYEKGSEIIRMMQTMVGRPGFRKGMDLYFERHDGQAVIIEDFAKAIAEPNNQDWEQFKLWYSQAGTPEVSVTEKYDASLKKYTLELKQSCPPSDQEKAEGVEKKAFHIPMLLGLISASGKELNLESDKLVKNTENKNLIHLKAEKESFEFNNVAEKPVLSLNREFSSPIRVNWEASNKDLITLMKYDSDAFNRWEASQKLYIQEFQSLYAGKSDKISSDLITAFKDLSAAIIEPGLKYKLLKVPALSYLSQLLPNIQGQKYKQVLEKIEQSFAEAAKTEFLKTYHELHNKNIFSTDPKEFSRRRLKNLCLSYLAYFPEHQSLVQDQFNNAQIMTDEQSAFAVLLSMDKSTRSAAIEKFHDKWKDESLTLNKWFSLVAAVAHDETFNDVVKMWDHKDFNKVNPNRVYSLLIHFGDNLSSFHDPRFETYQFMADRIIEMDKINPQVATRVAGCFDVWKNLTDDLKPKAHQQLERMVRSGLSKNTYEIVSKQLT